jgi:hypothetical protein
MITTRQHAIPSDLNRLTQARWCWTGMTRQRASAKAFNCAKHDISHGLIAYRTDLADGLSRLYRCTHACMQSLLTIDRHILKAILVSRTNCFYLKATCLGLDIDHHRTKTIQSLKRK